MTTLEALEQRVEALEKRVAVLQPPVEPTANGIDIPSFRKTQAQQTGEHKVLEDWLRRLGVDLDNVMSHEEFKKIRDAKPIPPEEEWASRELMRMREEKCP